MDVFPRNGYRIRLLKGAIHGRFWVIPSPIKIGSMNLKCLRFACCHGSIQTMKMLDQWQKSKFLTLTFVLVLIVIHNRWNKPNRSTINICQFHISQRTQCKARVSWHSHSSTILIIRLIWNNLIWSEFQFQFSRVKRYGKLKLKVRFYLYHSIIQK